MLAEWRERERPGAVGDERAGVDRCRHAFYLRVGYAEQNDIGVARRFSTPERSMHLSPASTEHRRERRSEAPAADDRDRMGHQLHRQLVRRVERGNLVALGQRWVVEHRGQKVIESATQPEHRLADVE